MNSAIARCTEAKEFVGADGGVFRYRLAQKSSADGSKVPLVIFLHGAGERGANNCSQLVHGVSELVDYLESHEKGYRLIAGHCIWAQVYRDASVLRWFFKQKMK